MDTVENRLEALRPEVDRIMAGLSARIREAITMDPLICVNPEISAIRDELLRLLTDPSNLQFGILKNEEGVPTTTETGRYLAGLAVKRVPSNAQGVVRMPVLPNRIAGECSFDDLLEGLGLDGYRKLIESECLEALSEIQERRAAAKASGDKYYTMTMRGGPSGTYQGGEEAQEFEITSFSQADIDNRYAKRANWLLQRLAGGESPFSVAQPFKKIRPDYKEERSV